MEEVKTMTQIAEELKINRAKAWRIIQKLGIRECSTSGTAKLYDSSAFERIKAEAAGVESKKAPAKPLFDYSEINKANEQRIADIKANYERLIAAKDETIEELRRQVAQTQSNYDELNRRFAEAQQAERAHIITMTRPKLLDRIKEVFKPSGIIE